MKNSTLRFSNRSALILGISSMTVFCHFESYSQGISPNCTETVPEFYSVAEKEVWIKEHPTSCLLDEARKKEIVSNPIPIYVSTGNPTKDEADYIRLKNEWLQNNPEAYKRLLEKASVPMSNQSKKN